MAKQTINIGTTANDGTGDPLRTAFDKVNSNFTELYNDDTGDVNSIIAGDGISVDTATGDVTITNTITNNNQLTNGAGYVDGTGTANYIPKWTDSDTIGNSVIYNDGTNVGIGTSSPATKLQVISPLGTVGISLGDNNNQRLKIGQESGYTGNYIDSTNIDLKLLSNLNGGTGGNIILYTGSTGTNLERMRLHSTGDISFRDSSANEAFYWDASTASLGLGTTSPSVDFNIQTSTGSAKLHSTAGGSNLFMESADGNVTRIRWNSNSNFSIRNDATATDVFNINQFGNVGIGTTSIVAPLTVKTSGDGKIGVSSPTAAGGSGEGIGLISYNGNHTAIQPFYLRGSEFVFRDASSEKMRIASTGNVGIGTSSPAYNLEIRGSSDQSLYLAKTGEAYLRATAGIGGSEIFTGGNLTLGAGNTERMRITSAGAIHLSQGTGNSYVGTNAGNLGTSTGTYNTANGVDALRSNTTGTQNTANGSYVLYSNTTGINNTANGYGSLYYNTTGTSNTANGASSLANNTTGSNNTANGRDALYHNTTGNSNTANGVSALKNNTTGINNVANGTSALVNNTTGNSNTANGVNSLYYNTTGDNNTALGLSALQNNTTGIGNIAIGYNAGSALTTGSNNTIIGRVSATAGLSDTVIIAAGINERMRIDSSGNVGIGTSSPADKLDVNGRIQANRNYVFGQDNYHIKLNEDTGPTYLGNVNGAFFLSNGSYYGTQQYNISSTQTGLASIYGQADGDILFLNSSFTAGSTFKTANERMRITSNGQVWIDATEDAPATNNSTGITFRTGGFANFSRDSGVVAYFNRKGSDGTVISIRNDGVGVGSISVSGSSTAYNTSSDYRLKEDWQPMANALDRVEALKPINFAWKSDGTRVDGFLAHELAEVIPEAVTGEKDAVEDYEVTPAVLDDEGNVIEEAVMGTRPVYQGIDQSKIVPLLVAAIQELKAEIELLKTK